MGEKKEAKEVTQSQIDIVANQNMYIWEEREDPKWTKEQHDIEWKKFLNECKEIAEEQIREQEEFFEIDYDQIKAEYDDDYFEATEIKDITKKAIDEKKSSLKFDFISHCTNFSFMNEVAIEIVFHSTFSILLKQIPIYLNNRKLYHKLHFNWQQDSGTGKGEAFKEKNRVLECFGSMYPDRKYKIKSMDGSETIESFYNTFASNKRGGYDMNKPVIGAFEEADCIDMEECSYIFVEKRGQKQTKAEVLLKALEGSNLLKRLASWEGRETITRPNFVFFGSTRQIPEVQETIATSGLLQRMIPYFRNIDAKTRQEMNLKNVYNKVHPKQTDEESQNNRVELCRAFRKFVTFTEKNTMFTFENEEDSYQFLSKQIIEMETTLYNTITRLEHQKIAEAFISRFPDKILVLAIHNAILRQSVNISLTDIQNACEMMSKIYKQLCLWIEQSIDENRLLRKRRIIFQSWIKQWFKIRPSYTKEEFVRLIVDSSRYSRSYAYHLIDTFSLGKNSLLKIENDAIMLNGKGGN